MRFLVGLLVVAVEVFAAAMFDVNGPNWNWWSDAMYLLAILTIVLVVKRGLRAPLPLAGAGLVVAVVALVVQSQRFNDSYLGSRLWPDLLACVFGAGVAAVELGLSGALPRSRRVAS